jgi:hypothetical protein
MSIYEAPLIIGIARYFRKTRPILLKYIMGNSIPAHQYILDTQISVLLPMSFRKFIFFTILFQGLSLIGHAQDHDFEFKIVKLKEASIYPDSLCIVKRGDTLRLRITGGFGMADVASAQLDVGTAEISDSDIIVRVTERTRRKFCLDLSGNGSGDTASLSSYMDTGRVEVHLKPSAHAVDTLLRKVIYILPGPPPVPTVPYVYRKTGFEVKWNKTTLKTRGYERNGAITRVIHHFPKEKLLKEMANDFKYQNYDAPDTSVKKFDSLYAVIITPKKSYRFHLNGNAATPEMMNTIQLMRSGDKIRLRLFWNDQGEEKKVTTYFRISVFSYSENGYI